MLFPCTVTVTANGGHRYEVVFDADKNPYRVSCIIKKGHTRLTWQRGIAPTLSAKCAINAAYKYYPDLRQ